MNINGLIHPLLALLVAPLLLGIINRVKALVAGRQGPPFIQPYRDILKMLGKGAVYSRTTTWVFRAGPVVELGTVLIAIMLLPIGTTEAFWSFDGDLVLLAYLLGVMRFFTVLAALDTGSSFEGMGASREVHFSALTEPVMLMGLAALARETGMLSLSSMYGSLTPQVWSHAGPALAMVAAALFVVFLTENSRIPIDDPNTHLELTMIHEVMILDYSGPDLALIEYGAALKLWVLGSLFVGLVFPFYTGHIWLDGILFLCGMFGLAVIAGMVESTMARLRLVRVPQLIVGAGALSIFALVLVLR